MKIFTIVLDDNGRFQGAGNMPAAQARTLIDALLAQEASEQGKRDEREHIRQGPKAKRKQQEADRPA